jgi:arylsulfatase A-like enzyme
MGTPAARQACAQGVTCKPGNYSDAQLDFYACLNELDAAVGRVLALLTSQGYRDNTCVRRRRASIYPAGASVAFRH